MIFCVLLNSTILLSIISLLSEPNTSSPANVDASVAYRKWVESKGRETFYEDIVRSLSDGAIYTVIVSSISLLYAIS